jgi:hypothetical protein
MAGHSRSKNGVASLAYVPAISIISAQHRDRDAAVKPAHDGLSRRELLRLDRQLDRLLALR